MLLIQLTQAGWWQGSWDGSAREGRGGWQQQENRKGLYKIVLEKGLGLKNSNGCRDNKR